MSKDNNGIRLIDLIYFDLNKAISIYSQMTDGLIERFEEKSEESQDIDGAMKANLIALKPELGIKQTEKAGQTTVKKIHHEIFDKLEKFIMNCGLAINTDEINKSQSNEIEPIHKLLRSRPYIKTHGWCSFQDFDWIYKRTGEFNNLLGFINKCCINTALDEPEGKSTINQLIEMESQVEKEKNAKVKNKKLQDLTDFQSKIYGKLGLTSPLNQWFIDGIKITVESYFKNKIVLRIYPFEDIPEFQFICNLQREWFIGSDVNDTLFSYTANPTIKLSVLGLITSAPLKDGPEFDPFATIPDDSEENDDGNEDDKAAIDFGFQRVVKGLYAMEEFFLFSRYPNIILQPIAIYRELTS